MLMFLFRLLTSFSQPSRVVDPYENHQLRTMIVQLKAAGRIVVSIDPQFFVFVFRDVAVRCDLIRGSYVQVENHGRKFPKGTIGQGVIDVLNQQIGILPSAPFYKMWRCSEDRSQIIQTIIFDISELSLEAFEAQLSSHIDDLQAVEKQYCDFLGYH